mgnify:CR=1 FL=1
MHKDSYMRLICNDPTQVTRFYFDLYDNTKDNKFTFICDYDNKAIQVRKNDIGVFDIFTKNNLIVERYTLTVDSSTSAKSWNFNKSKTGYTPIMHHILNTFSTQVYIGDESSNYSNGNFTASGYVKSADGVNHNVTVAAIVLWHRN